MLKSMRRGFSKSTSTAVAGLDIGTSKICCAIAKYEPSNNLKVVGLSVQASKGIRAGTITDMEALQKTIAEAVLIAEEQADEIIQELYISISPALCHSKLVQVELNVTDHSIDEIDIKKIIQQAASIIKPSNHLIIHTIPLNYELDDIRGIRDPRGMFGDLLKAKIHLLSANKTSLRNYSACVERSHLEVAGFITSTYASGLSTLVEDELDLGTTLIDMGAGTTSIGLFQGGKLAYIDHIPIGGIHITNDIARVLSTPIVQAERIKTLYGTVMASSNSNEMITIPQIGDIDGKRSIQITKNELTKIIRPRVEEVLEQIKAKFSSSIINNYSGKRLVLTGGASQLSGIVEMTGIILEKNTRLAKPILQSGIPEVMRLPNFSTCIGLLNYGQLQKRSISNEIMKKENNSLQFSEYFKRWLREKF